MPKAIEYAFYFRSVVTRIRLFLQLYLSFPILVSAKVCYGFLIVGEVRRPQGSDSSPRASLPENVSLLSYGYLVVVNWID